MTALTDLLSHNFIINALLASVFASISCGLIGTYIVTRRIVFISGGITHASFGGIGLGYFLGIYPVLGASVFGILTGIFVEYITKKQQIRNDSVIGMFWAFGMAVGIIFIYLTPGYAPDLMSYLFGSILTVNNTELLILAIYSIILLVIFSLMHSWILYVSFDEDFARTRGLPVTFINYLMIILVSITIVLNIKIMGIILLLSLLTIPQNLVNLFTNNYRKLLLFSVILAQIGSLAGLAASYFLNIPSGASIVFSLVIMFVIAKIIRLFVRPMVISR